ncbi:hypothetical protein PybrP1_006798 [[Pythium] brassicae (nom. inval.)]|nr:hypothetical protein PybrP1_006798 [[Pythium] brassicae (nom. inval.)]
MTLTLRALALCAAVAAATATATAVAADDRVLVLSAQAQLLHPVSAAQASPAGFSSLGLAELAMDALGLGSGRSGATAAAGVGSQSALQADIFHHARAYALVALQADGALLEEVSAATAFPPDAFHGVFPLAARVGAAQRTPAAIAGELATAGAGRVKCAGSAALCAAKSLEAGRVTAPDALVQTVLTAHRFLHKDVAADAQFARELAHVRQLTAELSDDDDDRETTTKTLFVVGLSDVQALDSSKRSDARAALATQVGAFLSALQKTHAASGAQVVAAREDLAASPAQLTALQRLDNVASYSRLLATLATEPAGSADDDDDDDDDDSGSGDSDAEEVGVVNGSRSSNATTSAMEKPSLEQIAEYQIVLWTSVLLAATLLLVVLAMCNMNTGRDSLLYAKFTTDANHRKAE